ncbi:hypothetical protein ACFWPX_18350 [Nocardia sp. NPDC058518]|uniref:hypothetical protein n=1 Tax=Nocardia sp. NPDC058518 TaxID=3346534 RepID=UPI003652B812
MTTQLSLRGVSKSYVDGRADQPPVLLTLVDEVERALSEYRGAVVVVSHDRALRRRFRGIQKGIEDFG